MPHHLLQSRSCSHTLSHHPKSKGSPINVVGSSVAFVDSSRLNKLARAAATAAIISLSTAAACGATCLPAEGPLSAAAVQVSVQVKGGSSADLAGLGPSPTLFLTARPANYKVPYASSKEVLPDLVFPRELILGCQNDLLLPEEQVPQLMEILVGQDVLVSARLDRDGDANTRDAEDLVGRGVARWDAAAGARSRAVVVLEGRGLFGKLVTNRQR